MFPTQQFQLDCRLRTLPVPLHSLPKTRTHAPTHRTSFLLLSFRSLRSFATHTQRALNNAALGPALPQPYAHRRNYARLNNSNFVILFNQRFAMSPTLVRMRSLVTPDASKCSILTVCMATVDRAHVQNRTTHMHMLEMLFLAASS